MADLIRYREGNVTVTVGDELQRWVDELIRSTAHEVLGAIELEVDRVYRAAVSDWPVKTGRSRAGLRTALTLDRTQARVEGSVLALVPYSVYIKPRKLRGRTTAWQEYVRGPMTAARKRLVAQLGDVIVTGGRRRAR